MADYQLRGVHGHRLVFEAAMRALLDKANAAFARIAGDYPPNRVTGH